MRVQAFISRGEIRFDIVFPYYMEYYFKLLKMLAQEIIKNTHIHTLPRPPPLPLVPIEVSQGTVCKNVHTFPLLWVGVCLLRTT